MKQISILFVALCIAMCTVNAQEKGKATPEERAAMQTEWLKTKLSLNSDQEAKISTINLKYAREMDPVLKGSDGKFAKLKKAKAVNEKKEAEYKAVLTSDQYATYQQMKSELKDEMKSRMKSRKQ